MNELQRATVCLDYSDIQRNKHQDIDFNGFAGSEAHFFGRCGAAGWMGGWGEGGGGGKLIYFSPSDAILGPNAIFRLSRWD